MSSNAHKVGSLLFCPDCGTLLSLPKDGETFVACDQCGREEPASSYENVIITTRSAPEAFPSALRQKRKIQTKLHETGDQGTLVSEKCPACGHLEAYSKVMQVRVCDAEQERDINDCDCSYGVRTRDRRVHHAKRMAGKQLDYTYTPTEQKRATMPKPPSVLARRATRGSLSEKLSFGRLGGVRLCIGLVRAQHIRGKVEGECKGRQQKECCDERQQGSGHAGGEGGQGVMECLQDISG
ncbi:hypothetical protein CPB84DRAFT_1788449 [Gymnopilus junonius]|uniref:DNA-directed RNA polymerase II subunit RPB9-like zinc ribbon domain-containing protein n=1 Tax=Gymnopilus junonius TaxID=109634 RepID=A0A9P5TKA1_GYMJU|nr:hypothetical protein CPB84DRAFT_1788449 [Gymnopilus junonius]